MPTKSTSNIDHNKPTKQGKASTKYKKKDINKLSNTTKKISLPVKEKQEGSITKEKTPRTLKKLTSKITFLKSSTLNPHIKANTLKLTEPDMKTTVNDKAIEKVSLSNKYPKRKGTTVIKKDKSTKNNSNELVPLRPVRMLEIAQSNKPLRPQRYLQADGTITKAETTTTNVKKSIPRTKLKSVNVDATSTLKKSTSTIDKKKLTASTKVLTKNTPITVSKTKKNLVLPPPISKEVY